MDINKMRLGLMYIFSESTKISNKSKLQLINFIEKASEYQLKVLAMDGQIVAESDLGNGTKKIIDKRFSMSEVYKMLSKAGKAGITYATMLKRSK